MRMLLIVALVARSGAARADDTQVADELFAKAQKLREQGKTAEACAAFTQSLQRNPNAIGTILNVARCAEEAGKFASAVRAFTEARDRAHEQNLTLQLQVAEEHLAALDGRAPHLAISFAESPTHDTRLVVDDHPVEITGAADILVDPGTVKIVVSAPGRVPYETSITIAEKQRRAVTVPPLGLPVTVKRTSQTIGKVMLGVGVAAAMTGEIIGLSARSRYRAAISKCTKLGDNYQCDAAQYSDTTSAVTLGNAGTGVGVAGLVLVGAGAVIWLLSPSRESEHKLAIYPTFGRDQAGFAAVHGF